MYHFQRPPVFHNEHLSERAIRPFLLHSLHRVCRWSHCSPHYCGMGSFPFFSVFITKFHSRTRRKCTNSRWATNISSRWNHEIGNEWKRDEFKQIIMILRKFDRVFLALVIKQALDKVRVFGDDVGLSGYCRTVPGFEICCLLMDLPTKKTCTI